MLCQYCGNLISEEEINCTQGSDVEVDDEGELMESARFTSTGSCDTCGTLTRREEYPNLNLELLYYEELSFRREHL